MVTVSIEYPDKSYCDYVFETMKEALEWSSNMFFPSDSTVYIKGVEYVK